MPAAGENGIEDYREPLHGEAGPFQGVSDDEICRWQGTSLAACKCKVAELLHLARQEAFRRLSPSFGHDESTYTL